MIAGYQNEPDATGRRCEGEESKRGGEITSCVVFRKKGSINEVEKQSTEANNEARRIW